MTGFRYLPSEKWKGGSSLQKSVRRGFSEIASQTAVGLSVIDPAWLMHRMSIVAVEDIGLGNVDLVIEWLSLPGGKRGFSIMGGVDALASFAQKFALSVKDRSACDLSSLVSVFAETREASRILEKSSDVKFLSEMVVNGENTIRERVLSGWLLAGTKRFPCQGLPEGVVGDWELFLESWRLAGVQEKHLVLSDLGMKKMREFHPVSIPMCSLSASNSVLTEVIDDVGSPLVLSDGKTLPCALDWHVAEGRRAISGVLRESAFVKNLFRGSDAQELFAKCLFRMEGSKLDKRLSYDLSDFLLEESRRTLSSAVGAEWQRIEDVLAAESALLMGSRNREVFPISGSKQSCRP